jgi:hypothetical protein
MDAAAAAAAALQNRCSTAGLTCLVLARYSVDTRVTILMERCSDGIEAQRS